VNKTLLLILCDFLLLNLLALTRWDKNELPPAPAPLASQPASAKDDVVSALRLSLEEERNNREKLARDLATTRDESKSRASVLDQARARTAELSERLQKAEQDSLRLAQQAGIEMERSRATLEAAQAEAATLRQTQEKLRTESESLRSQLASAAVTAKAAEERAKVTETSLRTAEEEKKKLLEQNQSLSKGVNQLAEKSGEMTKEIRDYRPVAPNSLYADYLARRATVLLCTERTSAQSSGNKQRESKSILLTDGNRTAAVLLLDQTPLGLGDAGGSWNSLTGSLTLPPPSNFPKPIDSLQTLKQGDPRFLSVPVGQPESERIASSTYRIATDPFRFSRALLISPQGSGYGECSFRLEPNLRGYLEMDSRFMNRLQGEYAPSAGDLVLTLAGEFLGMMVNDQYCAQVTSLEPSVSLSWDSKGASKGVGEALSSIKRSVGNLDSRLR
jgi:hypothetical protein